MVNRLNPQLNQMIALVIKLMVVIVVILILKEEMIVKDMDLKAYKCIKDFVKLNKKCIIESGDCEEDKVYSIDYKSSYLVLSLLSLILLFL